MCRFWGKFAYYLEYPGCSKGLWVSLGNLMSLYILFARRKMVEMFLFFRILEVRDQSYLWCKEEGYFENIRISYLTCVDFVLVLVLKDFLDEIFVIFGSLRGWSYSIFLWERPEMDYALYSEKLKTLFFVQGNKWIRIGMEVYSGVVTYTLWDKNFDSITLQIEFLVTLKSINRSWPLF